MKVLSNAKINLNLQILGKDDSNYHLLYSVVAPISLYDEMEIVLKNSEEILVTTDNFNVPNNEGNICYKAIKELKKYKPFYKGVEIKITKNIPIQAGLGGGSSNAAFVLKTLNKMLDLNLTNEELKEIGSKVGADVPFFIDNKISIMEGRGEKITNIDCSKFNPYILLVKPKEGVNTKEIFDLYDNTPQEKIFVAPILHEILSNQDKEEIDFYLRNDLLRATSLLVPNIRDIIFDLKESGAYASSMSGSGTTCFGLFDDLDLCKKAEVKFEKKGYFTKIVKII